MFIFFFFFQAEDGIRDVAVTGVQTCALPIFAPNAHVIRHHFTVDVEEYFQVSAFESRVRRSDWGCFESRLTGSVSRLLDLLARHEARGTFFVVGWVAERHPDLVQLIARAGHEVASPSG